MQTHTAKIKNLKENIQDVDTEGASWSTHTLTLIVYDLSRTQYLRLARAHLRQETLEVTLLLRQLELPLLPNVDTNTGELLGPFNTGNDSITQYGYGEVPDSPSIDPLVFNPVATLDDIKTGIFEKSALGILTGETHQHTLEREAADFSPVATVEATPEVAPTVIADRIRAVEADWERAQWLDGIRIGDTVTVNGAGGPWEGIVQGIEAGKLLVRNEMGIGVMLPIDREMVKFLEDGDFKSHRGARL